MAIRGVVTYDLKTPPGGHNEFRAAMEKRSWRFSGSVGHPMPNTTCWVDFATGATAQGAMTTIQQHITAAANEVAAAVRSFQVERYYAVAFEQTQASEVLLP